MRGAYAVLVGKTKGKIPPGKPRRKWKDNIKIDVQEVRWGPMNWIDLLQDRDRRQATVSAVMNIQVP
jgi:hypothetical protein